MYYIGFFKNDRKKIVKFYDEQEPTRERWPQYYKVMGPFSNYEDADSVMNTLVRLHGYYRLNPAVSERQRLFMCAELGRLRAGKKRKTRLTERQLREFCRK